MSKIIDVINLEKRFGEHTAVDHIQFSIEEGKAFGLLGPNGAGKTTTIRMLITLIPPTSGVISIAGLNVQQNKAIVRRLLGYVPQSLSADASLTGYENLLVVAKLLGLRSQERKQRIEEVLETLNLTNAAHQLVQNYSGGMVRRLEIGQAILNRPRILILDEPTVGLDPTARHSVWETVETLRRNFQMTLLITTHYMEEADNYCQRVAIMNHGQIVAIGTPAELKAKLNQPWATLEDVFTSVTGDTLESGGSYRETKQLRQRTHRFH